ncbi:MAG: hypothetical protein EGR97_04180 [Clostridiales bacterium]|nr:hypothetical protein [Clostridiales bacterium]
MYYGLIMLSTLIFSGCFWFKDIYREQKGSSFKASFEFSFYSGIAGFLALLIINKFSFEFSPFTFIIAMIAAVNGLLFTICSFKALDKINLSVYSVFSMLGGMALPFAIGIIFYNEAMTLSKGLCFVSILIAILFTLQKGESKKGTKYYLGVFVLNGMSGVLTKIFTAADYTKTSPAGYSILTSVCSIALSAIMLFIISRKEKLPKTNSKVVFACLGSGIANRLANYILVAALLFVDASVQYPMVTGGVMIISTLICLFTGKKVSKCEMLSVLISFIGLMCLFLIK